MIRLLVPCRYGRPPPMIRGAHRPLSCQRLLTWPSMWWHLLRSWAWCGSASTTAARTGDMSTRFAPSCWPHHNFLPFKDINDSHSFRFLFCIFTPPSADVNTGQDEFVVFAVTVKHLYRRSICVGCILMILLVFVLFPCSLQQDGSSLSPVFGFKLNNRI